MYGNFGECCYTLLMVGLLLGFTLAQSDATNALLERCVDALRSWESRFDRVRIDAASIGGPEPSRHVYIGWPGAYELMSSRGASWKRTTIDAGRVAILSGGHGAPSSAVLVYGTELTDAQRSHQADAKFLLFGLSVLVFGDVTLSQAMRRGELLRLTRMSADVVHVKFKIVEPGISGVIEVEVDCTRGFPPSVTHISPKGVRLRRTITNPGTAANPWKPVAISASLLEAGDRWTALSKLRVNDVRPVSAPPRPCYWDSPPGVSLSMRQQDCSDDLTWLRH